MDLNWILDMLTSPYMSLFFLFFLGYFCWHNVYDYNDLADAITAISTNEAGILISYPLNINENLTIPSNITLRFIRGGTLNVGKYSIRNATYKWTSSPAAANEFYLELAGGGDPGLTEPPDVFEDDEAMRHAALGSLVVGEWNFGDNDTLGYETVYVRITGSADPDGEAEDYVEAAYQVTIAGTVDAGLYRIFEGVGSVVFSGTRVGDGILKDMYPHWRGTAVEPLEAVDVRGGIKLRDRDPQAIVTFTIDDDNAITDWPALFASKGVNAVSCPDIARLPDPAPYLALQTAGWEIAGHTQTHPFLSTLSEEQIEYEVGDCKALLESWGFNVRNFVLPNTDWNELVLKIIRKYYLGNCGLIDYDSANRRPFRMDRLARCHGDNLNLADLQTLVDDAISSEGWLIVMLHTADAPKLTKIGDLIDYIQGEGVQILTMSEAEDLIGNLVDSWKFRVSAIGEIQGILPQASALPTIGTWKQGDRIWNIEPVAGGSPGWVCVTSGTFSTATDNLGDTTNGSPIITGMDNSFDFWINEYVTVSAGFPAGVHKIIGRKHNGAEELTLDVNATGTVANVTVETPDPIFEAMAYLDYLNGSLVWDPGDLIDGAGETSGNIAVTGAAVTDRVEVFPPYSLQAILCMGYVSAVNVVNIRLQNETGGAINLVSGTWKVKVHKY